MGKSVFIPEPKCIASLDWYKASLEAGKEEPYKKIFFRLALPEYDSEIIDLCGSRVYLHALAENGNLKVIDDKEGVGTAEDNMPKGRREYFLLDDSNKPIEGVFARLDSEEVAKRLKTFAFDSENTNDTGWVTYFNVNLNNYNRESTAFIPLCVIAGYEVNEGMSKKEVSKRMLVDWSPSRAVVEFNIRKGKEYADKHFKGKPFEPERTTRSNDLLTVTTIIKREPSPFTVEEVDRRSADYGKPLAQVQIVKGSSVKYALVDRVSF